MNKTITCLLATLGLTSAYGRRSANAANRLAAEGYKCVIFLGDGIDVRIRHYE